MGSFVMRRVKDGFVFQLYAPNRLILSTSPVYITEDACKKGILTVMEQGKNAGEADLTDAPERAGERFLVLRTGPVGWPLGKTVSVTWKGENRTGIVTERSVDADSVTGRWESELIVQIYNS